jgi:hypothetical protein
MDLADASLVAVAETHRLDQIFSLDSDFYIYRLANGTVLDLIRYMYGRSVVEYIIAADAMCPPGQRGEKTRLMTPIFRW